MQNDVGKETILNIISTIACAAILSGSLLLAQNNEFLLDTNLTYIPAPSGQNYPSIAFDGTNYFIVWYDQRHAIPYHSDMSAYWHIYGCRVSPEGVVLDSAGILISYFIWTAGYIPCKPAVGYGDGKFLCVWSDFRDNMMMYGARVDTNGAVLDPDGFVISTYNSWKDSPAVAFDGFNYFVVWWDGRDPNGIYGCRITPDGTILDPEGILIATPGGGPSVIYDGINHLVVWSDYYGDIYGVRVDTSGTVLDSTAITICTATNNQLFPSGTFGSEYYLVVWEDWRSGSNNADIYGARIDTAGILLDTSGIVISTLPESENSPVVAFDGTNYLVAWSDYAHVYCARVDTTGIILDPEAIVVSHDTAYEDHSASITFDSTNYFISWFSGPLGTNEVYGARVDTSGAVIDDTTILLSTSGYPGRTSSASFDGTDYFTVWTDYRDTANSYIYGAHVDTFGTILDPAGIGLMKGKNPSIAFDGTNYLLTSSDIDIKGARINTAGTVLDTIIIFSIFPNHCDDPGIVFNEDNYFVAFVAWFYSPYICCVRVDTSGAVLDTNGIIVSHGDAYDLGPSTAFDDSTYFVVWYHGTHETTFNIYGARISATGVLVDTTPISIAAGSYRQWYPSVAFDEVNYLVVWQDNRNGLADIYGARVTPAGVVLDPEGIPICTALSGQYKPEIKFDGHNYCVIWEDWRNGDYPDIYGCYVNPSGTVIEEFIVSDQPNIRIEPALTKGLNNFLVTYTGFADNIGNRPANTMRIWGEFQACTGIKETAGDITHDAIRLFQNFPNPFRQITEIRYQLTGNCKANLNIYDVSGRLVRKYNYPTIAESDHIIWDGRDDFGCYVGAGVYFYCLDADDLSIVKKMIFIRE